MDIVVENLTKSFDFQKAVDSISFTAKKGEILGFLGPNGAGKTTTMKIMSCFLFPDYGNIYFDGLSIHKHAYRIKQSIGYLSEHNPLYEDMNVIDFLYFVAKIHNIPVYKRTSRIIDMIRICGLEHEKHKDIKELSKGFRQRIGLAQALIHDPEVLILDEPTTGLDPNQIMEIREVIKHIGKEKTVIMSSHILAEIEATCDRVLIINKGKIVANGTSAELRQKSNTEKLIHLHICGAEESEVYHELTLFPDINHISVEGNNHFNIQCPKNINIEKNIFELCVRKNWYIGTITPVETSLEEIFREVTQN